MMLDEKPIKNIPTRDSRLEKDEEHKLFPRTLKRKLMKMKEKAMKIFFQRLGWLVDLVHHDSW